MRINPQLMEMCSDEHDINYFMLLLYQMVFERSMATPGFKIVELGVRTGNSTVAFLAGLSRSNNGGLMVSCDIEKCEQAVASVAAAGVEGFWDFRPETDSISLSGAVGFSPNMVFIDTSHERDQTVKELEVWSEKLLPRGRIILHDTLSRPEGVGAPVAEFLARNREWKHYNIDVCCGLAILDKP